jgi:hypothetical protein
MTVGRIPNVEGGIQPTLLTTTGDIMYASSASNPARLGIGSSAQVLTVASGVPSWATPASGGMTLLSTTTLSGASTTISGISGAYNDLYIVFYGISNATADGDLSVKPNNENKSNYYQVYMTGGTPGNLWSGEDSVLNLWYAGSTINRTISTGAGIMTIYNYAQTTYRKNFESLYVTNETASAPQPCINQGWLFTTSAITSLVFANSGGNFSSGTVLVYGVK